MKGLPSIPNSRQLARVYDQIQSGPTKPISSENLALWSQWARLDPRLAEILVGFLSKNWRRISWGEVLMALDAHPWPHSLVVLLRFVVMAVPEAEKRPLSIIISGLEKTYDPPPPQLYFIPLQKMPNVTLQREVNLRAEPYFRSGFFGSQSLLTHGQWPSQKTVLDDSARREILKKLMARGESFTVKDYRAACGHRVSSRQAQRDLEGNPNLRRSGFTRGRSYKMNMRATD